MSETHRTTHQPKAGREQEVAAYWKENYDLAYILKRDWAKHGKNWEHKIHLYCGDMDNYYFNNAVYLTEEMLKETSAPHYKWRGRLWRQSQTLLEWRSRKW